MNIDKFKRQHDKIFDCIETLRRHAGAGITEHAQEIASAVVSMSSIIKLHLKVEDTVLYPALRSSTRNDVARMGDQYQEGMKAIANSYEGFARRWNIAANVASDPEGFRTDANIVLKKLYARILQEDKYFYPAIEAM